VARFSYITVWRIEAPLCEVWNAILHSERWPAWWKSVREVREIERGDLDGTGNVRRYIWRGRLPYDIKFLMRTTRVRPMVLLEGVASGQVEGVGRWEFAERSAVAVVRYEWNVRTATPIISLLAPLTRPLINWNHDGIMQEGGEALARLLHSRMVEVRQSRGALSA
jgi:Polyketide cyclase / dehydrase and lipid transport